MRTVTSPELTDEDIRAASAESDIAKEKTGEEAGEVGEAGAIEVKKDEKEAAEATEAVWLTVTAVAAGAGGEAGGGELVADAEGATSGGAVEGASGWSDADTEGIALAS